MVAGRPARRLQQLSKGEMMVVWIKVEPGGLEKGKWI